MFRRTPGRRLTLFLEDRQQEYFGLPALKKAAAGSEVLEHPVLRSRAEARASAVALIGEMLLAVPVHNSFSHLFQDSVCGRLPTWNKEGLSPLPCTRGSRLP